MKKFIIKIILFILPLSVFLIDGFLPVDTFAYRPWEALKYNNKNGVAFPFYPNQDLNMHSSGDLLHHTEHAIIKKEHWITDKLGYRNDVFVKKPNIVLIGDSFITGSGLTQDSTLTNVLKNKLNTEVYNMAPASFNDFISLISNNIIEKPKLVIFSKIERDIPAPIKDNVGEVHNRKASKFSIFKDKIIRLYSFKYLKARLKSKHGNGISGKTDSTMSFLNGKNQKYNYDEIDDIVKTIKSYKNYCKSIGARFIFLPIPNKETVYFDKIPLKKQPDFIPKLDALLSLNKVEVINTQNIFNQYNKSNTKNLYHLDDTHWNFNGLELISKKIIKLIGQNELH
ncbi:hypothetical protein [Olleya sp. R77988]|uniref:hypothetical protein n=1 Tax=Olleya sp. R77988 TaxID=3093875 RepID=UPI0037CBD7DA